MKAEVVGHRQKNKGMSWSERGDRTFAELSIPTDPTPVRTGGKRRTGGKKTTLADVVKQEVAKSR